MSSRSITAFPVVSPAPWRGPDRLPERCPLQEHGPAQAGRLPPSAASRRNRGELAQPRPGQHQEARSGSRQEGSRDPLRPRPFRQRDPLVRDSGDHRDGTAQCSRRHVPFGPAGGRRHGFHPVPDSSERADAIFMPLARSRQQLIIHDMERLNAIDRQAASRSTEKQHRLHMDAICRA